ncbi:MAG: hypothetical protein WA864_29430 [Acetobacteraceae bacterium]
MSDPPDYAQFGAGAQQALGKSEPARTDEPLHLQFEHLEIWMSPGRKAIRSWFARMKRIYPGDPAYGKDTALLELAPNMLATELRTHLKTGEFVSCRCVDDAANHYHLDVYLPDKRDGRSWVQAGTRKVGAKGGGKALLQAPISDQELETLLREIEAVIERLNTR